MAAFFLLFECDASMLLNKRVETTCFAPGNFVVFDCEVLILNIIAIPLFVLLFSFQLFQTTVWKGVGTVRAISSDKVPRILSLISVKFEQAIFIDIALFVGGVHVHTV